MKAIEEVDTAAVLTTKVIINCNKINKDDDNNAPTDVIMTFIQFLKPKHFIEFRTCLFLVEGKLLQRYIIVNQSSCVSISTALNFMATCTFKGDAMIDLIYCFLRF